MFPVKKIAIVYDWIDKWGGVERLLITLHEMFPQAQFYTSYYDSERASWAKNLKIKTSFIQKLPTFVRRSRLISFPFYPYAFESFDFSDYNLVISLTSSFAKSIITKPETIHICFLLTPIRYLWINPELYFPNKMARFLLSSYLTKLKNWDFIAAQRPDKIISISQTVADRCRKYYQRESEVIYPPFDVEYWKKIKNVILRAKPEESLNLFQKISHMREIPRSARNDNGSKYFLCVSRLEPYKRVELALQSIAGLKSNLVVVGRGSQAEKLRKIASEKILFFDNLTDEELGFLYSSAEALIMPQEEDFGYVSLEAQFFGCPVIALNKGGVKETVSEGKTGIFFSSQTIDSVQKALNKFDMVKYRLKQSTQNFGQKNVEKFAKDKFIEKFLNTL